MKSSEISVADAVRQFYFPFLHRISSFSQIGVRGWLQKSDHFIPIDLHKKDCFEITFYDIFEFVKAWAGDIVRLSSASLETVNGITDSCKNKKFLAWQLVEQYYSAFYAAHSTLKICSFGLVQLDNSIINNIKKIADIRGVHFTSDVTKGIYCVDIISNQSKAVFYKVNRYDDSHRGLWHRYADFIDVIRGLSVTTGHYDSTCVRPWDGSEPVPHSAYSQLPRENADLIIQRLELIRKTMDIRGDNNWLSSIRNNINYNQSYGIWFPYVGYMEKYESLVSMKKLYLDGAMSPKFQYKHEYDLEEFVNCCQLIISINYELLADLESRNPLNKSFLKFGTVKLINLHQQ